MLDADVSVGVCVQVGVGINGGHALAHAQPQRLVQRDFLAVGKSPRNCLTIAYSVGDALAIADARIADGIVDTKRERQPDGERLAYKGRYFYIDSNALSDLVGDPIENCLAVAFAEPLVVESRHH